MFFDHQSHTQNPIFSSKIDAKTLCKASNFSPYQGERRVYDLIMFSTELDWLDIRLHTLASHVDFFVIIESPTTFTGAAKPLVLKRHWNRFARFHKQMIYRVVEDPIDSSRIWDPEDYLRNSMLHAVFPTIEGEERAARHGDVLVVSDMDEIVRPEAMLIMRYCEIPARLTLRTQFFYYSFLWRHRGQQWPHPQATIYKGDIASTLSPNDLRMDLIGPGFAPFASLKRWWDRGTLWDAGWHCSSCFSTIGEFQTKMNSFSHQGWNTEENQNARTICERVRSGQELFEREGEVYDKGKITQMCLVLFCDGTQIVAGLPTCYTKMRCPAKRSNVQHGASEILCCWCAVYLCMQVMYLGSVGSQGNCTSPLPFRRPPVTTTKQARLSLFPLTFGHITETRRGEATKDT